MIQLAKILFLSVSEYPDEPIVRYSGWNAFDYYYGLLSYWWESCMAWYSDYSWQVRMSFALILTCIGVMIALAFMFFRNIRNTRNYEKELRRATERLHDPFYNILISVDEPSTRDVEIACDMTAEDMNRIPPKVMADLISNIRMELNEVTSLPNIQMLCNVTGVTRYFEANLVNKRHIMKTLQYLVNMHLRVSEGLLAIYINHYNNIRHMARMSYMVCTETEPYRYLEEDLQEKQSLWRPMLLHRLFGWLKDNERPMPQFLVLASVMKDQSTASFLIQEVAYWGSEKEKASIKEFFLSPMLKCRESALKAVALLKDESQEQAIIDSYDMQPENLRRDCLKAVHAIDSGRHTEFFVDAFYGTSSKETKECALNCLYSYGHDGRRRFEMLRLDILNDPQGISLLNQIDSMELLQQMRMF